MSGGKKGGRGLHPPLGQLRASDRGWRSAPSTNRKTLAAPVRLSCCVTRSELREDEFSTRLGRFQFPTVPGRALPVLWPGPARDRVWWSSTGIVAQILLHPADGSR